MKKSNLCWIICLTISLFVVPRCAVAQTVQATQSLGDSLLGHGQYKEALYYYQRARFFAPPTERSAIAHKMAITYELDKRHETALEYYDYAINAAIQDSVRWALQLEKSAVLMLHSDFKAAYIELLALPDLFPSDIWERRRNYYLGNACLGMESWVEAEQYFTLLVAPKDSVRKAAIHHIFELRKHKNIKVARVMSMVLPGSGQVYAGDIRAGLNSFVLTGTIATIGVVSAIEYGWSGCLWTVNWFARYYRGGIREAGEAAERRNRRYNLKLQERVKSSIIH